MAYETEFFLTGLSFVLFLSIITIFGFLLIYILYKDIINLPFLELVVLSLGSGIIFYFLYSYFIEIFLFFNFFTILLPIIIFNIIVFIFLLKFDLRMKQKLNLQNIKQYLIKNKKDIIIFLLFFFVVIFFQFEIQYYKIVEFEPLLSTDPYYWCRNTMYLIDYGHIDYDQIKSYAPGFLLLNGGINLIFPRFRLIFFFQKFAPIFYMTLIIFIGFVLSRIIFKQKFLIFLIMFGFLTLYYFNYRFLIGFPSALATILFLIFTITFIDPEIPYYFKGILLAGPMLCHSLLGGIAFSIFFIYIILHFFSLLIARKESKKIAYKFLKENFINILIFLGFISFYLYRLIFLIQWYIGDWFNVSSINIFPSSSNFNANNILLLDLTEFSNDNIFFDNLKNFFELIQKQIWYGKPWFFLVCFYFFIRIRKKNYKKCENFIAILKISAIFLFLFLFLYYFMISFFPSDSFGAFLEWFSHYGERIFEFGAGVFIFMFIFTIHDIYFLFGKITVYLKKKFPIYNKFLNRNNLNTLKGKLIRIFKAPCRIESVVIIFGLCFTYYLFENNRRFAYSYKFHDNEKMEMILALGDCESPNPTTNITILLPESIGELLLKFLYRYNVDFFDIRQDYPELKKIILSKNASYVVIPINDVSENIIRQFVFSYEIFFETLDYFVFKIN